MHVLSVVAPLTVWGCYGGGPEGSFLTNGGGGSDVGGGGVTAGGGDRRWNGLDTSSGAGGGENELARVPPSAIHQPSAAGTATNNNQVLRFSLGAPQPMGKSHGANLTLNLGPNASGR